MSTGAGGRDAGVATVLAAVLILGMLVILGFGLALGSAVLARHRAEGAADLAALAAASRATAGGGGVRASGTGGARDARERARLPTVRPGCASDRRKTHFRPARVAFVPGQRQGKGGAGTALNAGGGVPGARSAVTRPRAATGGRGRAAENTHPGISVPLVPFPTFVAAERPFVAAGVYAGAPCDVD